MYCLNLSIKKSPNEDAVLVYLGQKITNLTEKYP
jgi:hypothetical protein